MLSSISYMPTYDMDPGLSPETVLTPGNALPPSPFLFFGAWEDRRRFRHSQDSKNIRSNGPMVQERGTNGPAKMLGAALVAVDECRLTTID